LQTVTIRAGRRERRQAWPKADAHPSSTARSDQAPQGWQGNAWRDCALLLCEQLDDFEVGTVKQVGEFDPSITIWRYLTFAKFESLIQRHALWFSKLQIFEDEQEGMTPALTRASLKSQHRQMENWFPDEERKRQVRRSACPHTGNSDSARRERKSPQQK
jgi:hypothetical protein